MPRIFRVGDSEFTMGLGNSFDTEFRRGKGRYIRSTAVELYDFLGTVNVQEVRVASYGSNGLFCVICRAMMFWFVMHKDECFKLIDLLSMPTGGTVNWKKEGF